MKIEYEIIDKEKGIVRKTTLDERWYGGLTENEKDFWWKPSVTWIASYYPKGAEYMRYIANKGWDESERIKNEAGDRGTIVHHAIQKGMEDGKLLIGDKIKDREGVDREMTPDEYYCALTFKQWWESVGKPKPVAIERTVISQEDDFAGTLDYLFEDGLLLDIKTSKDIWPSHELQLSSLKKAALENGLDVKKIAILQVGYTRNKNQHYKFTEIEDQYNLFLSAKTFWKKENNGSKPFQRDYPLEIIF